MPKYKPLIWIFVLLISISVAFGLSGTEKVQNDTNTHQNLPNNNYGSDVSLEIQSYSGYNYYIFLHYNLSNITGTMTAMNWTWYHGDTANSGTGDARFHICTNVTWNEWTLTWNKQDVLNQSCNTTAFGHLPIASWGTTNQSRSFVLPQQALDMKDFTIKVFMPFMNNSWSSLYAKEKTASRSYINWTTTSATPLSVTLGNPDNNSWNTSKTINFTYTTAGDNARVNCSLFTNETSWSLKHTNSSTANGISETFTDDGQYLWNILCYDTTGAKANATNNYTIKIDSTPPTVTLADPDDNNINSSRTIAYTYTATDNNAITTCQLWNNYAGAWSAKQANTTTANSITYTVSYSEYLWNIKCTDIVGLTSFATNNFTLTTTPIAIIIQKPANNSVIAGNNLTFNFTAVYGESKGIGNCSLYGNFSGTWGVNQTLTSVSNGVETNFNELTFPHIATNYLWDVRCWDNNTIPTFKQTYTTTDAMVYQASPNTNYTYGAGSGIQAWPASTQYSFFKYNITDPDIITWINWTWYRDGSASGGPTGLVQFYICTNNTWTEYPDDNVNPLTWNKMGPLNDSCNTTAFGSITVSDADVGGIQSLHTFTLPQQAKDLKHFTIKMAIEPYVLNSWTGIGTQQQPGYISYLNYSYGGVTPEYSWHKYNYTTTVGYGGAPGYEWIYDYGRVNCSSAKADIDVSIDYPLTFYNTGYFMINAIIKATGFSKNNGCIVAINNSAGGQLIIKSPA